MEFAREDAKSDIDLHFIAEKMVKASDNGEILTMKHYDMLVAKSQ